VFGRRIDSVFVVADGSAIQHDGPMPPLTDAVVLAQFLAVLANWRYTGYVTAKDHVLEWIADELAGLTLKDVSRAMYDFLQAGGVIDQIAETRPQWNDYPFHYDFRLHLSGRFVYIETVLDNDDPADPTIRVVSIHDV
jgi:hypothetical protein